MEALTEPGTEIKVSYDTTTYLHAKAWLFQRKTGFSTDYIASPNLPFSAMNPGLGWKVRASQRLNPELITAFERTFSTYWEDPHSEPFDRKQFVQALTFVSFRLLLAGYGVLTESVAALFALPCATLFAVINQLNLGQWPYAAATFDRRCHHIHRHSLLHLRLLLNCCR